MGAVMADAVHPGPTMGSGGRAPAWRHRAAQVGGAAGLVGAATAVSLAWAFPATRPLARFCCRYSPGRLSHGAVWTLLGSALLLPRLRMIGPTTILVAAFFVPYVMVAGTRRAVTVFFAGHVAATVAVAAVVLPAAAWGWPPAVVLRSTSDVGASAGLAAAAGALAGHLDGRGGGWLGAALLVWFGSALMLTRRLVEVEHLLALATGAVLEHRGGRSGRSGAPWSRHDGVSLRPRPPRNTLMRGARAEGHDDGP